MVTMPSNSPTNGPLQPPVVIKEAQGGLFHHFQSPLMTMCSIDRGIRRQRREIEAGPAEDSASPGPPRSRGHQLRAESQKRMAQRYRNRRDHGV